jgi:tetratricopeptide (TPR) repeat protein
MSTPRRKPLLTSLLLAALVIGAGALVAVLRAGPAEPEYPDAPFRPVPQDFPRVIPVKEQSTFQEQQAVYRFLVQDGAIRLATAEERDAVKAVYERKYVRGRELAEKALKADPTSVPALYALAQAQFLGEGNLPQGLFQIRKVRRILEKHGRANPEADSREWYLRVLYAEYLILQAMDRPEEQLRVVAVLEQIYEPLPWLKVWPLFKVRRLEEARRALATAEQTGRWRLHSLNSRCALEEQSGRRQPTYEAGQAMVKAIPYSPVLWSNFGLACRYTFRLDEAESAYLRSVSNGRPDFHGTAYRPLALLYLQQGRVTEALSALKKGQAQRATRAPHTLQQDQTKMDQAVGLLLLVLGKSEDAERFVRRSHEQPDRTGSTTDDETDVALVNGLAMWTVLESRLEQLAEEDAGRSGAAVLPDLSRRALAVQSWTLKRGLLKILHDPERLRALRPYMPGTPDLESWLSGGLVRLLPPGVATEAVRQARAAEDHPDAIPYFDALDAEVALLRGDAEEALAFARRALEKLPPDGEKLLRARVSAVGGEAALRLGKTEDGLMLLHQALRDFPEAFRLLKLSIPARVEDDGSPAARLLARRLLSSPRFVQNRSGFRLVVRSAGGRLTVEMFRMAGERHCEISVPASGNEDEVAAVALRQLHERVMSPTLDLSQIDINSLDGSPSALRTRQEIDQLLQQPRLP